MTDVRVFRPPNALWIAANQKDKTATRLSERPRGQVIARGTNVTRSGIA